MTKIKLRKKKRKVYFEYHPWIPLKYYTTIILDKSRGTRNINGYRPTLIIFDDIEERTND